jgi:hypothetical protein
MIKDCVLGMTNISWKKMIDLCMHYFIFQRRIILANDKLNLYLVLSLYKTFLPIVHILKIVIKVLSFITCFPSKKPVFRFNNRNIINNEISKTSAFLNGVPHYLPRNLCSRIINMGDSGKIERIGEELTEMCKVLVWGDRNDSELFKYWIGYTDTL